MIVGARFVCGDCRLRGYTLPCPRCGQDRLDLALPDTAEALSTCWPEASSWRAGRPITSLRSWLGARTAWALAAAQIAVMFALGASMRLLVDGATALGEVLGWGLVALALVPLYAGLLYGAAVIFGALWPIGSLGRLSAVLPCVRLDTIVTPPVARGTATLRTPLVVRRTSDPRSWMPHDDAWLESAELELDGDVLVLDHAVGTIVWGAAISSARERVRAEEGYREPGASAVPAWARDPGREVVVHRHVLPVGTLLVVRGGRVADDTLRGSREHPLHLEVFAREA